MAQTGDDEAEIPKWIFKVAAGLGALFGGLMLIAVLLMEEPAPPVQETASVATLPGRAQMLVLEASSCGGCTRFRENVAPEYEKSRFDSLAPLRYLELGQQANAGYRLTSGVSTTPTFVLVDASGREVARFMGYVPARQFLAEVEKMVANPG